MEKNLLFQFKAFDAKTVFPGPHWTEFFVDDDSPGQLSATAISEGEILKWILNSPAQDLFLSALEITTQDFVAFEVKKPLIEDSQSKPGDIDLFLCEKTAPNRSIAVQAKRVKVTYEESDKYKINKLDGIRELVEQANGTRELGFHRAYCVVLIVIDSRAQRQLAPHCRFMGRDSFQRVFAFPQRESLHDDVGVVFVEIAQTTGRSIDDTAIVAVSVDRRATYLDQWATMTDRVKQLMRSKGINFE
jgi:hypothetical protein